MERPAKRWSIGLVVAGVQEQAEDIGLLVPPLLRNCLTLNDILLFLVVIFPMQNSGSCNSFYCLSHCKMSMMMMKRKL